jgi:hypothetical protein
MKGSANMTTMDVRMEALVRGNDGATLGRVWAMLLVKWERDFLLAQVLVAGGAYERDTFVPFVLLARSSGQQLELSVAKGAALAGAATGPVAGSIRLDRNDPVFAVDARLGHIRGCYVTDTGVISDLLINDEVSHQLSLVSMRAVDEISAHQIQLGNRISEMGELLKPPQALYAPVELRRDAERLAHSHAGV